MTSIADDIKVLNTVRDCMRWGVSLFNAADLSFGHGMDTALDEVIYLTLHALHLPPDFSESFFDARITEREREAVVCLLRKRLISGKPAAQLTGEAWFAGLKFIVNEHVLVPRSPIAELIESRFAPWLEADEVRHAMDLCAGSGCIGIAMANVMPQARVDMLELSSLALAVAEQNVELHGLDDRVKLVASDLFATCEDLRYDLIVSNPPYVPEAVLDSLPQEYQYEPQMALAAGADGMDVVERILREAGDYLHDQGLLFVEVGMIEHAVMERWSSIPFTWLEFVRGGSGVFMLSAEQLRALTWD